MNNLAVAIALILLPGLVASVICDKITVHSPRWDAFKYSIYSFLFGVLSYVLLQATQYAYHQILHLFCNEHIAPLSGLDVWSVIQTEKPKVNLSEVAWATALAPVVALVASVVVNYKLINKFAQKIKASQKYGDENLFSFFLNAKEVDWVYVRDKEAGFTYFGRVVSHSECDAIQELVLSEVTVHDYESSDELYAVSVMYLSKPLGALSIEVPERNKQESSDAKEAN